MAKMNFGGVIEEVMTREEFPLEKAREILKDETIAVIGYGVQGPGQACNLRDNGFNVIVGQRQGKTYEKAIKDGWVPGETLFSIEEAAEKGTIVMCLLSDAAVMSVWPTLKQYLTAGKALYFSHGFAITWNDRTGCIPAKDIDVIMVAPKGSGTSLRTMFLEGRGLNSSYAVYQTLRVRLLTVHSLLVSVSVLATCLKPLSNVRLLLTSLVSAAHSWVQFKVFSSLSMKCFVRMVTHHQRHSMRRSKSLLSHSCHSSLRRVWIGCMPTALPQHSVVLLTG